MTINLITEYRNPMMNMVKDIKNGDLKVIDFDCLNVTLKINWLKSWLKHSNLFWCYSYPKFPIQQNWSIKMSSYGRLQ